MRALSEHLTLLIATAEDIMRRPAQQMVTSMPASFPDVAAAIRHAHERPAEATRTTRAGIVMVEAIEAFIADGSDRWQMLIGATLPVLRHEAFLAFRNEKEARGS